MDAAVSIRSLKFSYKDQSVFSDLSLEIPGFSCTLILGRNGVGKSTLLRLIAGKHLIAPGSLQVLGQDPFSGGLTPHDVTLVGERFPLDLDLSVKELLEGARKRNPKHDLVHERAILDLFEIDPKWRMHRVSNGQRRRVDLLLSLIAGLPRLVLLDEVTADLDILCRQNILRWLREQALSRRMTVVFATHILDGMEDWASHVVFLRTDKPSGVEPLAPLLEREGRPLLSLCEARLR